MPELPSGTVTFLFTDIEGSTRLWEEHPDAMLDALARHHDLLGDTRRATTVLLLESLGCDRLDALRAEGAALDTDDAVAFTLAHLDAFLANAHD